MKIIKEGLKPEDQLYRFHCKYCQTLLEFTSEDYDVVSSGYNNSTYEIKCIFCNKHNYFNSIEPLKYNPEKD